MPDEASECQTVVYKVVEKNVGKKVTLWRCSVRSKRITCPALVSQVGEAFTRGTYQHIHPSDQKITLKAEISAKVKGEASDQVFRPAMNIVEDAILDNVSEENLFLKPKEQLMKRAASRYRAKMRPTEPIDLDFELNRDFLIGELRVREPRYLVLRLHHSN